MLDLLKAHASLSAACIVLLVSVAPLAAGMVAGAITASGPVALTAIVGAVVTLCLVLQRHTLLEGTSGEHGTDDPSQRLPSQRPWRGSVRPAVVVVGVLAVLGGHVWLDAGVAAARRAESDELLHTLRAQALAVVAAAGDHLSVRELAAACVLAERALVTQTDRRMHRVECE
jgi:hypothetical protein